VPGLSGVEAVAALPQESWALTHAGSFSWGNVRQPAGNRVATPAPQQMRSAPPNAVRFATGLSAHGWGYLTADGEIFAFGHDGIVVADGDHVEGNLPVRPPSAGVAAVQQIALTTWDWATLLKRVWGFDALTCTGCGGRMRFIAVIKDRAVIERILKHLGEDAEEPKFARARDPCDLWA